MKNPPQETRIQFAITLPTCVGPLAIAGLADGAVTATAFGDLAVLATRLRPRASFRTGHEAERALAQARSELTEYFAAARREFSVPLAPVGSPFQLRVWTALRAIAYGETRTYGDLARELGSAPRAIGRANATNPISVIVPCHRVIGAGATLTGYAFGVQTKERLLALERDPAQLLQATFL
jgi:methylated-DNA-[protein]-cysteine S-methyltransferase